MEKLKCMVVLGDSLLTWATITLTAIVLSVDIHMVGITGTSLKWLNRKDLLYLLFIQSLLVQTSSVVPLFYSAEKNSSEINTEVICCGIFY